MDHSDEARDESAHHAASVDLRAVGPRIIDLRNRLGWTQRTLARQTGLRPAQLSKIERSRKTPLLDEIVRITQALGVGLDELVFGRAPRPEMLHLLREVEALGSPEEIAGLGRILQLLLLGYKAAGGRL
jgi:transcriptional regulator with XRE-family HTH domain